MFETIVANVLNKFLGDFVDNLEHKQLNIGIWSGRHIEKGRWKAVLTLINAR